MKNNFFIFLLFFSLFINEKVLSQEVFFDASNVKVLNEGNIINAFKGKALIPEEKVEVYGDESIYDKEKQILTIIKNVKFYDKKENIYIEGDKIIYNKLKNIIYSIGDAYLEIEDKYKINSSDLYYDRNLMKIYSSKDTHIEDNKDNFYNFENGFDLNNLTEILSSKKAK